MMFAVMNIWRKSECSLTISLFKIRRQATWRNSFVILGTLFALTSIAIGEPFSYEVKEFVSAQTYAISGGAMASYGTRHAAFILVNLLFRPTVTYNWQINDAPCYDVYVLGTSEIGVPYQAFTPYTAFGGSPGYVSSLSYTRYNMIGYSSPAVGYKRIPYGYKVPIGIGSTSAIAGGAVTVVINCYKQGDIPLNDVLLFSRYIGFDLSKLPCSDAGIDTRRTFGSPNLAGKLPGDPNVPSAPANFGNYTYHGGLFLGNVPSSTGDHSGTARTQLYVQGSGSGTFLAAGLSIMDMGTPPTYTGSTTVGV